MRNRIPLLLVVGAAFATISCFEPSDDGSTNRYPGWNGELSTVLLPGDRPIELTVDEDSEVVDDPCAKTEADAHKFLETRCGSCHDAAQGGRQGIGPIFDFVMNDDMLKAETWNRQDGQKLRFLIPGDVDNSLIYIRPIVEHSMPPPQRDPSQPETIPATYSDGSVLREWINNCMEPEAP